MRLPLSCTKESRILTRVGANINKVSLASSECVCVCVCLYKIPRLPNICATICGALTKFDVPSNLLTLGKASSLALLSLNRRFTICLAV